MTKLTNESVMTAQAEFGEAWEAVDAHLGVLRSQFGSLPPEQKLAALVKLLGIASDINRTYRAIGAISLDESEAALARLAHASRSVGLPVRADLQARIAAGDAECDATYAQGMILCFDFAHS